MGKRYHFPVSSKTGGICESFESVKALVTEDTLLGTHCCSWCFLGCANWETFVADTKCFWTKSETFLVSRTQNLCPQHWDVARAGKRGNICVGNKVVLWSNFYPLIFLAYHVEFHWQADSSTGSTPMAIKNYVSMATHSFPVPTHLISIC